MMLCARLAAVVLPAELGTAGIDQTAEAFVRWVRGYRAGAEMDHGYGNTRLRSKGASPAAGYLRHLEALRPALLCGRPGLPAAGRNLRAGAGQDQPICRALPTAAMSPPT